MKSKILDIHGKEKGSIELPKAFSETVREDIIAKVIEARKTRQPYSPSPVGGKQHAASGKIQHTRHVWKSMQGRGISKVPRKIMSRRGTQFNWVGAEIPNAVGGRRARARPLAKIAATILMGGNTTAFLHHNIHYRFTSRYNQLARKSIASCGHISWQQ